MVRRAVLAMLALALTLPATSIALARPDAGSPARVQTEEGAEAAQETAPAVPVLALGERFALGIWDLEIQDAFREESPVRQGYDEVRLSVAFRNNRTRDMRFTAAAMAGEHRYPRLQLRDSVGQVYEIPPQLPRFYRVAGSNLVTLPPAVPAHWTVGFQVPTPFADRLHVEAVWRGDIVASWNLLTEPRQPAGWTPPDIFRQIGWGAPVAWGEQLEVAPVGWGLDVCGDNDVAHFSVLVGLTVGVENLGDTDAYWPNVNFPGVAAIAIWRDGSSARFFVEGVVIPPGADDDEIEDLVLNARTLEQVIVPPRHFSERAMYFTLPRDARFVDVTDLPEAFLLYPPGGEPVWLDVAAGEPADLDVDDLACALSLPEWLFFADDIPTLVNGDRVDP